MSGGLQSGSFTFESAGSTGVIHQRKVDSTKDLLPRRKFRCWRSHSEEIPYDLPRLRRTRGCFDFWCNPLSVRYACRPIIRPWPAVLTILFIALLLFGWAIAFRYLFNNRTLVCKLEYPSIIFDPTSQAGQDQLLLDSVNFPWVNIGVVNDINPADVHRVDEVVFSPSSCGDNLNQFVDDGSMDALLYYQLEPFYQNHRLYIFSRDNVQLHGDYRTPLRAFLCSPMTTLKDAIDYFGEVPTWWEPPSDNLAADEDVVLHPCGLQALSVFNDTFEMMTYDGVPVDMDTSATRIVLKEDIEIFQNPSDPLPTNDAGQITAYTWLNRTVFPQQVEEPQFINWMRLSTNSRPTKLIGALSAGPLDLPLKVNVKNRFSVAPWEGSKSLVITVQPKTGSVVENVSTPFFVLAIATLMLVLVFSAKLNLQPRLIGDIRLLYKR